MLSLALEPALQTQTPSGAWQGTGVRGQAGVAPFVFSAAPSTREFGSTYPSKQDSQLWPWGIARPRVAKSSDTLKRCQNETSFLCNLRVKKHFFFFTSRWGGSNKTYLWISSLPSLRLTFPVILIFCSLWSHWSKFDFYRKDYSIRECSSKYCELICCVLMGLFPLLSFSFLCSWKTCTRWQRPTPSQRPPSLLLNPPPDMGLLDLLEGEGTALW